MFLPTLKEVILKSKADFVYILERRFMSMLNFIFLKKIHLNIKVLLNYVFCYAHAEPARY